MPRQVAQRSDVIPALGELFRERGFADTSLSEITERTGLGKGSLYNFFPDGKQGMARAVLDEVTQWFDRRVFGVLAREGDAAAAIEQMFDEIEVFFQMGRRVCLFGAFALDCTRDQFAGEINRFFKSWIQALAGALQRAGLGGRDARDLAEDVIGGIQGALVLTRAEDDPQLFVRALERQRRRVRDACQLAASAA